MKIIKEFNNTANTITYKVFDGATQLNVFATDTVTLETLFNTMHQVTEKFCWSGFNKITLYALFNIATGVNNALVIDLTLTGDNLNINKGLSSIIEELDIIVAKYLSDNKFNILLKNNCIQDIEF